MNYYNYFDSINSNNLKSVEQSQLLVDKLGENISYLAKIPPHLLIFPSPLLSQPRMKQPYLFKGGDRNDEAYD